MLGVWHRGRYEDVEDDEEELGGHSKCIGGYTVGDKDSTKYFSMQAKIMRVQHLTMW